MTQTKLNQMRVAILVSDGFEESELMEPRRALDEAGAETIVIAAKAGTVQGMKHDEKTKQVNVDMTLDKAKPYDFDAVLLPGGALNADHLRVEKAAQEFVRSMGAIRETDCRYLPRALAAGFGGTRKRPHAHQLSHDSRRHSQRRR